MCELSVLLGGDEQKRLTTELLDSTFQIMNLYYENKFNQTMAIHIRFIGGYLLVAEESFSKRVSEVYNLIQNRTAVSAEYLAKIL